MQNPGMSCSIQAARMLLVANSFLLLAHVCFVMKQQQPPISLQQLLLLSAVLWVLAGAWTAMMLRMPKQKPCKRCAVLGSICSSILGSFQTPPANAVAARAKDAPDLYQVQRKEIKGQVQKVVASSQVPQCKHHAWQGINFWSHCSSYQPTLQREQVNIKVLGKHEPADLPDHMAQQLHCRLRGTGHQLLGLAARRGCVCICVDFATPLDTLRTGRQGSAGYSTAELASMVLPLLQPMLQQHLANEPNQPTVLVQLGQTMLTASYNASTQAWKLEPQVPQLPSKQLPAVRMMLGVAKQLPAGSSVLTQQMHTKNTAVSPSPGALPTTVGSRITRCLLWAAGLAGAADTAGPQQTHSMQVAIQLLPAHGATALTTCQLAALAGWEAPRGDTHEDVSSGVLRLLARCSGTYITTCVLEVSDPTPSGTMAAVKLELHVPDSLLPRHHMGGAPVGLLPVTLELWQGALHCISSTPLLLQLPAASGPAAGSGSAAHGISNSCWWWGASRLTMQRAIQDLQQTNTSIWLSMHSARSARSMMDVFKMWQAFCEDLLIWLRQLQYAAVLSGYCTANPPAPGLACSVVQQPTLPADQLLAMGSQLLRFAQNLELRGVQQMLQQQHQVLQIWCQSQHASQPNTYPAPGTATRTSAEPHTTATTHAVSAAANQHSVHRPDHVPVAVKPGDRKTLLLRSLQAVFKGATCTQCEARFRDHMAHSLAGIQVFPSCLFALAYLLRCAQAARHGDFTTPAVTLPWALLHITIVAQQLRWRRAASNTAASRSVVTQVTCAAYWSRVGAQAVFSWSSMALSKRLQAELSSGRHLVGILVMTLGEQVSSMLLLPPVLAVVATLFESINIMAMMQRVGALTPHMALVTLTAIMVPRVIVETCFRMAFTRRAVNHVMSSTCQLAADTEYDAARTAPHNKGKTD